MFRGSHYFRCALAALHLLLVSVPCLASDYELEILKSQHILRVKKNDKIEKIYQIATGRGGPGTKAHSGDKKTPIGIYRVVDVNPESKFHLFIQLNYPNIKDAFYGYKRKVISRYDFERIVQALGRNQAPPYDTDLGGMIGIHGIGEETENRLEIHRAADWTKGCIAMTNAEVSELRQYVDIGTRVHIRE